MCTIHTLVHADHQIRELNPFRKSIEVFKLFKMTEENKTC